MQALLRGAVKFRVEPETQAQQPTAGHLAHSSRAREYVRDPGTTFGFSSSAESSGRLFGQKRRHESNELAVAVGLRCYAGSRVVGVGIVLVVAVHEDVPRAS